MYTSLSATLNVTSFFSNKGKTAYVYPAYELSHAFGLWPK